MRAEGSVQGSCVPLGAEARGSSQRGGRPTARTGNAAVKDTEDEGMCPWRTGGKQAFNWD